MVRPARRVIPYPSDRLAPPFAGAEPQQRVNIYLPATLAQRVWEARQEGRDLNLSEAAQGGIAAALSGQQPASPAVERPPDADPGRLEAIERTLTQLRAAVGQLAAAVAVLVVLLAGSLVLVYVRVQPAD